MITTVDPDPVVDELRRVSPRTRAACGAPRRARSRGRRRWRAAAVVPGGRARLDHAALRARGRSRSRDRGTSWIGTVVQAGSVSVPGWPFPIVAIFEKATEPKFASGTGRHEKLEHDDGASAIHSAEVRSGVLDRDAACEDRAASSGS